MDSVREAVCLEMLVDFLDDGFDVGVAFDFLLDSLHDEIDFLVVFAGGVILSVDRLLESHNLLVGPVWLVGRREVLFLLVAVQFALAESFGLVLVLFG